MAQEATVTSTSGLSSSGDTNGEAITEGAINETSRLLPHQLSDEAVPKSNTHYRNIDGTRFWWLFACIVSSYTLAYFDSTFMASSHPVITSYFNASNAASWLSTVFYLTSTVSQPLYGRISDVVGRKPVYIFAIAMFGLTTLWCGMAQSIGSFIAARTLCGLGAGGVITMANILMSDTVRIEYRGIYQSYLNLSYGFGNGMGASLGGLLCDRLGWRAAFYIQLPLILGLMLLASLVMPNDLGPCLAKSQGMGLLQALKSFDFSGAGILILAVAGLILGINLGGNILRWTHPLVLTSLGVFVLASLLLIPIEKRAQRPMLPLRLLSSIPNGNLNWANLLTAILTSATLFNVPLFLQAVKLVSPTTSGLVLLSPLVGVSVSSVFGGFFISWTRKIKLVMVVGVLSLLLGTIALSCLNPRIPLWAVLTLIPWVSIGQGFFFPATTVAILAINPVDEQAVVVTTLGLYRNLGSIMGVAMSSWVLQNALIVYLHRLVTGSDSEKAEIISQVRKSIKAIAQLDPRHRNEVIEAYARSVQVTFLSGVVIAVVVCCLVFPAPIPDLKRSRSRSNSAISKRADENEP